MKSKTIIISSQYNYENSKSGRGILTLFQEDDLLKCRLRLYNVNKLSRYCKLAIYHNNEVFSANILEKNGVYESSFVGDFDIDKDFYSAIIDTANDNNVILSGGTYAGFYFNDNSVFEKENMNNNFKNIEKENPNTNLYEYNNETDVASTQNCNNCDKCNKCKYKEYFYSNANTQTEERLIQNNQEIPTEETKPTNIKEEKTKSIISAIIPQFKYVFENYEQDKTLNNLIPNSKFVKINENNEQYSIGAIYDNEEMKYICYAVMCNYNTPAPIELGEHYQWLPLDKEDPLSEGYYIVFQDAKDLKILEL